MSYELHDDVEKCYVERAPYMIMQVIQQEFRLDTGKNYGLVNLVASAPSSKILRFSYFTQIAK